MSIYNKPLSQISTEDLNELLTAGAVENVRLEFKLEVPSKDETLKKLSSFANTFGGYMVVGAEASSADGRIVGLPGVDPQAGYKQKIVAWCFEGANPPLTAEVSDPISAPTGNGKVCYIVYASESDLAPHFLNGRKGIYVRTDEFSARFETRLADERELRHLFDRRKAILERRMSLLDRARRRFDAYADRTHTDQGGSRTKLGPVFELCVVPRFPARPLCNQEDLKALLLKSYLSWRDVGFPISGSSTISQQESVIALGPVGETSMFEANTWGMLFYSATIADAYNPNHVWGIHLYGFIGLTLLFIRHAASLLQTLGYSGSVHIDISLSSMLGVPWLHGASFMFPKSGSEVDDDIRFSLRKSGEEICEKPDAIVMDILRYVFFAVNWSELVGSSQKLEDLVRMGYQYNSWQQPTKLQI